jgi:phosphohistidine phosphatase
LFIVDLFILRHATAGSPRKDEYQDEERSLTTEGIEEAAGVAGWIAEQDWSFDLIATSPLSRARETAAIVAAAVGTPEKLVFWEELRPGKSRDVLIYRLDEAGGAATVLIVGHEPCLSSLIGRIVAANEDAHFTLGKCGMAKIRNVAIRPAVSGELEWLVSPDQVRQMRRKWERV